MLNRSEYNSSHDLSLSNELRRKAIHLVALIVPLGMFALGREASLLFLLPATLLAISLDIARFYSERAAHVVRTIFGSMMRPDEWHAEIGFRLNGATWVLVAATLLTLIFPISVAVPAFATFMVADAAAAIVGRIFGRHHWRGSPRTLEGSVAFFVTTFALLVLFPQIGILTACIAGLIGAAAEAATFPVNDNIRAPLLMAATLWLMIIYL